MGTLASEFRSLQPADARPPQVYADANVPAWAIGVMRQHLGWDVLAVVEHDDLRRARDREHYVRALELGRTVVTLDRDFLDDETFPPALSPGVVVLFAPDERALGRLLALVDASVFKGATGSLPLRGQKIHVTVDWVSAAPDPAR